MKIGYLGDNFKNHFLGKVETNISATTLTARTLTKSSLDGPILTELGDRAQTSLVHLWHFLSRQPNGESGILLTNGNWNVLYIKDDNGTPSGRWTRSGTPTTATGTCAPIRWPTRTGGARALGCSPASRSWGFWAPWLLDPLKL